MSALNKFIFVVISLALLSCGKSPTSDNSLVTNFKDANEHLLKLQPELSGWCQFESIPTKRLVVDSKNRKLLFFDSKETCDTIRYTKVTYKSNGETKTRHDLLNCNSSDEDRLDALLVDWFGLENNDTGIEEIAISIDADLKEGQAKKIQEEKNLSWHDKVISLLYNACIGNAHHDIVIGCYNKKLLHLKDSFLGKDKFSFIDTVAFIKFIKSGVDLKALDSPKAFFDSLTIHNIIQSKTREFDYLYYDIRGDTIYFGEEGIKDDKVQECKIGLLEKPQTVFTHHRGHKYNDFNSLHIVLPELDSLAVCVINDSIFQQSSWNEEHPDNNTVVDNNKSNNHRDSKPSTIDKDKLSILLLGLFLGLVLCILLGLLYTLIRRLITKRQMEIKKINQLTDKLITIYSSPEQNDEEVSFIVNELKNLCGKEFNIDFVDVQDLIVWKREFNKKHRFIEGSGINGEENSVLSSKSSIKDILSLFDKKFKTNKAEEYLQEVGLIKAGIQTPQQKAYKAKQEAILSLDKESSVPDVLKAVDAVLETNKSADYEHLENALKQSRDKVSDYEPLYKALAKLSSQDRIDIKEVISVFENTFDVKAKIPKGYKSFADDYTKQQESVRHFNKLLESNNEKELVSALNSIRNVYGKLPHIKTLASLTDSINKEEKAYIQINEILKQIDAVADTQFYSKQRDYIRRTGLYDKCSKMVSGVSVEHDLYTVLSAAIEQFNKSGQTVDGAVDFIQIFKPALPEMKESSDILRVHHAIENATSDFVKSIESVCYKDNLDYWDRLAFILSSVSKCASPILNILNPENKINGQISRLILDIKNDLLISYISRFFFRDSQKEDVTAEQFRGIVTAKVEEAVSKYNSDVVNNDSLLAITLKDSTFSERISVFEASINKNRGYESMLLFIDRMWDSIVKEFLEKAKACEDESYIIGQALNIAYHTADFLDHIKSGRDIMYCYNYAFLLNDFDPIKTNSLEFKLHDYSKSTTYSDFIYELADKHGIEHLKILIDNYFIKP